MRTSSSFGCCFHPLILLLRYCGLVDGTPDIRHVRPDAVRDQQARAEWIGQVEPTPCSRILIASPLSSPSHTIMYASLAQGLADRCHRVDMLVAFESGSVTSPNVTQTSSPTFRRLSEDLFLYRVDEMPPYSTWDGTVLGLDLMRRTPEFCSLLLEDAGFRMFLDKPDGYYDFVMVTPHLVDDCVLAFAHKARRAGKPWGFLFVTLAVPWVDFALGNPTLTSYRPSLISTWSLPMTFFQQVASQLIATSFVLTRHHWSYPGVRKILQERWDETMPDLAELERTAAIALVNEDRRLFGYQGPKVMDMIDIGGIHCLPAKPLPKELNDWAESAEDGFILFALGTSMRSANFPEEARKMFVDAFSRIPRLKFLWKWDLAEMAGLPENAKLVQWLPQNDVLGHRNIRAFITHGGMLSTQEATYHGVPVIGVPIAADQHVNMARVVGVDKAGEVLHWEKLTADKIVDAIHRVLEDESLLENVRRRSVLLKDQPETPLERGIYWTDYVIRNKYNTGLRSPTRDMYWFEIYSVHIWLFIAILVTATICLCSLTIMFLGRKLAKVLALLKCH